MILTKLREKMTAFGVDAYLIPTTDFHGSEYVGAHFAARAYVSKFTGSAGTLLVLKDWAGLWTDGRYFLQAEKELSGTGITLMKQGLAETESITAMLRKNLAPESTLGFDGRCVSISEGMAWAEALEDLSLNFFTDRDLVGEVWEDRPPLSAKAIWELPLSYAGERVEEKLFRLRESMAEKEGEVLVLTVLEEIAWLLNLRGDDIPMTPVFLAYALVSRDDVSLFVQNGAVSEDLAQKLSSLSVKLFDYEGFYAALADFPMETVVLLDETSANCLVLDSIAEHCDSFHCPSLLAPMMAVKNETEQKNTRLAHLKDGVARCKFIYWLKSHVGKEPITELSASAKLEEFCMAEEHYLSPSFSPIMAYGAHGAIVHYSADETSNATFAEKSFLLMDTGGQYLEGTTDCTRTIALGSLTAEEIRHYTAVLAGHLNLLGAKFLKGCTGANLDYLARSPLWALGLDYLHGTGHGVGHVLGVHQGANRFHWRATGKEVPFEAGMITSDEPGLYLAGKYGIRLENLTLCADYMESDFGKFLQFEALTLLPFERCAIDVRLLSEENLKLLNDYHKTVYEKLSPYLTEDERLWLEKETAQLTK